MWRFKACPRCKGDLFLEKDRYGWYEQCLQCGYLRDMETVVEVKRQLAQEEMERELARVA